MAARFGFAPQVPPRLIVDSVGAGIVSARSNTPTASCPLCGVVLNRATATTFATPPTRPA